MLLRALAVTVAFVAFVSCSSSGGTTGAGDSTAATTDGPASTAAPSETIGYLGCSNTRNVIAAYHELGGTRFWPDIEAYGGGVVVSWSHTHSDSNAYWKAFKKTLAAEPATVFWFQLCAYPETSDQQNYDAAVQAIDGLRELVPGAIVYVSPVNGFVPPHVCRLLGEDGPARLKGVADRLAEDGVALRGPDVGDLLSTAAINSEGATKENTETDEDGCHPNESGAEKLARVLMDFPAFR